MEESTVLLSVPLERFKDEMRKVFKEMMDDYVAEAHVKERTRLLKVDEVCEILRVSKTTVNQWKKDGKLPFHRIGGRIFFTEEEIMGALKKVQIKRNTY